MIIQLFCRKMPQGTGARPVLRVRRGVSLGSLCPGSRRSIRINCTSSPMVRHTRWLSRAANLPEVAGVDLQCKVSFNIHDPGGSTFNYSSKNSTPSFLIACSIAYSDTSLQASIAWSASFGPGLVAVLVTTLPPCRHHLSRRRPVVGAWSATALACMVYNASCHIRCGRPRFRARVRTRGPLPGLMAPIPGYLLYIYSPKDQGFI